VPHSLIGTSSRCQRRRRTYTLCQPLDRRIQLAKITLLLIPSSLQPHCMPLLPQGQCSSPVSLELDHTSVIETSTLDLPSHSRLRLCNPNVHAHEKCSEGRPTLQLQQATAVSQPPLPDQEPSHISQTATPTQARSRPTFPPVTCDTTPDLPTSTATTTCLHLGAGLGLCRRTQVNLAI
jgi:hypothetical protein